MSKYLILLALTAGTLIGLRLSAPRRGELTRLRSDREALLSSVEHYRLRDSLAAASVAALTLKADELETHFAELSGLIKELNLKPRRVETIAQTALETRREFAAPIRDTTIRFDDGHVKLEGVVSQNEFRGTITSRDTLTQIVHRVPRRLWFIRYGTRSLRQQVVSSNPHTCITYARYLRVEK